jgi:hypothetical protein
VEPDRSLRLSIWEGALSILFINWSTGVILTGYALALGASPGALAILGGFPFWPSFSLLWPSSFGEAVRPWRCA